MPFRLNVEITGVCVHVQNPEGTAVAVLMPDARCPAHASAAHVDGSTGVPHVGYVRLDLANVTPDGGRPPARPGAAGPPYEVVYRFDRQSLDFGLAPSGAPMAIANGLPDIGVFANALRLKGGLFAPTPGPELLFRTVLYGGSVTSGDATANWTVDGTLNLPGHESTSGTFPGKVTWTREVDADRLTLTVADFDSPARHTVVLRPAAPPGGGEPVLALKLANLCADNPLEWPEFPTPNVVKDDDFKWVYRLFEPVPPHTWAELLAGRPGAGQAAGAELPVPVRGISMEMGEHGDCFGGRTTYAFPAPAAPGA